MRKAMFLLAVFGLAGSLWAADPFVGTWKLNVAKSTFSGPPPKSDTVKIEAQENGVKVVGDGVDAEGKPTHAETAVKYDGKDYPYTTTRTGAPSDLTNAVKKIDANTHEDTLKQGGKVVLTVLEVVSKDGKTMTRTLKRRNPQGQDVTSIQVLDKQ
jgi:hypothetical protein